MEAILQAYRRDRSRRVAAYVTAGFAFVGLLSGTSRPLHSGLADLLEVVPFFAPREAAVTLIFVSFALLLTARGLRRGSRLAWIVTIILLLVAAVLQLVRGVHFAGAAVCVVGAIWLVTRPRVFPVLPSRAAVGRTIIIGAAGTALAVAIAIVLVGQLDRLLHQDFDEGTARLVAALNGHRALPRRFRDAFAPSVIVAIGISVIGLSLWLLLSPRAATPLTGQAHRTERERARILVKRYGGGTLDYFALRDDKQWFFVSRSVVAHTIRGGVCLVSPDPIGPPEERGQVWAEFMMYVQRSGWSVTVLGASTEWLPVYEATGLHRVYLGDEAVVDCPSFSLVGGHRKSLRQAHGRLQRAGYTVSFNDPLYLDVKTREALLDLSTQSRHGDVERGFSMTLSRLFDAEDTGLMLSLGRDPAGMPKAFVQWIPATAIEGWSLDVMRRSTDTDVPNGIFDFLVIETIRHVQAEGGQGLGLNFAMFRNVIAGDSDAKFSRALRKLIAPLSRRAQMESLWRFNAKYHPGWVPRYAVVGSVDFWASQSLVMANAEGFARIPGFGRPTNPGDRR